MSVTFSFEEGITQVSWQSELLNTGQYTNLWGPLLSRHQETPAGILHLWYVMNRMLLLVSDMVNWKKKTQKITLIFCSVPRYLLEDVGRGSTDPFMISDYTHGENKAKNPQVLLHVADFCLVPELGPLLPAGGWYTGPTYRPQNVLLTNSLEIIEKIWGMCIGAWRTQAGVAYTFLIIFFKCGSRILAYFLMSLITSNVYYEQLWKEGKNKYTVISEE